MAHYIEYDVSGNIKALPLPEGYEIDSSGRPCHHDLAKVKERLLSSDNRELAVIAKKDVQHSI